MRQGVEVRKGKNEEKKRNPEGLRIFYLGQEQGHDNTPHLSWIYKIFSYLSITHHFLSPRENDVARNMGYPKYSFFFPQRRCCYSSILACVRISPSRRMESDGLEMKRPRCWSGPS